MEQLPIEAMTQSLEESIHAILKDCVQHLATRYKFQQRKEVFDHWHLHGVRCTMEDELLRSPVHVSQNLHPVGTVQFLKYCRFRPVVIQQQTSFTCLHELTYLLRAAIRQFLNQENPKVKTCENSRRWWGGGFTRTSRRDLVFAMMSRPGLRGLGRVGIYIPRRSGKFQIARNGDRFQFGSVVRLLRFW